MTSTRTTEDTLRATRRAFLTSSASGLGAAALASLITTDHVMGADRPTLPTPHFPPRARAAIFIFLAGGTSQLELFDPKPKLRELTGQKLPESFTKKERFAFIEPEKARIMPSRFGFRRYGDCGMEMSELLPGIGAVADRITLVRSTHTDSFDHGPAEILFATGDDSPGRPSAGAWISYGLGSESRELPSYVVLMTGRGPVSRSLTWGNAFLPNAHAGVLFRQTGEPLLNLSNPPGVPVEAQRAQLDAIRELNRQRFKKVPDPRITDRIEAYELAFRMQASAPGLIDLRGESARTHEEYGTGRPGAEEAGFATNCLLARRLVERGVRFVSLFHRRWDHHSGIQEKLRKNCHIVDRPIGALIRDLEQRGLLDDTLVVCGTEFGRTPVTQNSSPGPGAGRDHHRLAFTTWMAGGGARRGHVVGATDELGWRPVENAVHVHDLYATILHLFGIRHEELTFRHRGLDFRLTDQGGRVVEDALA